MADIFAPAVPFGFDSGLTFFSAEGDVEDDHVQTDMIEPTRDLTSRLPSTLQAPSTARHPSSSLLDSRITDHGRLRQAESPREQCRFLPPGPSDIEAASSPSPATASLILTPASSSLDHSATGSEGHDWSWDDAAHATWTDASPSTPSNVSSTSPTMTMMDRDYVYVREANQGRGTLPRSMGSHRNAASSSSSSCLGATHPTAGTSSNRAFSSMAAHDMKSSTSPAGDSMNDIPAFTRRSPYTADLDTFDADSLQPNADLGQGVFNNDTFDFDHLANYNTNLTLRGHDFDGTMNHPTTLPGNAFYQQQHGWLGHQGYQPYQGQELFPPAQRTLSQPPSNAIQSRQYLSTLPNATLQQYQDPSYITPNASAYPEHLNTNYYGYNSAQQRPSPGTSSSFNAQTRLGPERPMGSSVSETNTKSQKSVQTAQRQRAGVRDARAAAKGETPVVPSNAPPRRSRVDQEPKQRGGRQKGDHLSPPKRDKVGAMRKRAACWRCILQRDPCDEGSPCPRCMMRAQKGQTYFFDCDRSKLPDFVHDFLPPQASMTLMHQKQTIEDTVKQHVRHWDSYNPIDIYLTSGYGPALRWKVYEFQPTSEDMLWQLQYLQNPITGQSERKTKYSPPFALMQLNSSDDTHFEDYLDQLMRSEYLCNFGEECFEEETQFDPDGFQARLLTLMCTLYMETQDDSLHDVLREVLRMMIITYIMGHTLTLVEDTLPSVLSAVKMTPASCSPAPHTSPRLANRQLKFFFSLQRLTLYERILKWQQSTLHTSGRREASWLCSFCVLLGLGMVLEEVQRTIQIQADAEIARGDREQTDAMAQAFYACERIDARHRLLVGLFQCKYRDRKWGVGAFGNGTPEVSDPAGKRFLADLRRLVETRSDHLQSRKDVTLGPDNQIFYTSRLVARFLLPFLTLPP